MNRRFSVSILALLVLTAAAAAQVPYGYPTPGPGGISPVLVCGQPWMGNAGFSIGVNSGLGGAGALIGISTQPAFFAYGPTAIFIDPDPLNLLILQGLVLGGASGVPGAGSATFPLPLNFAPNPALAGATVFTQAIVDDPANPGVFAATQAMRLELGYPPMIFVGTSVGGSVDPYYFVDPFTQTVVSTGGNNFTNNVSGGVFAHGGKDLFVSTSIANQISRADLTGVSPAWSTLYSFPGHVFYGIGHDWLNDRVYSLSGATASTRELVAVDSNPASGTYGQVVGSTAGIGGGATLERWGFSRSGKVAAIPAIFGSSGSLILVDTDAASATYLQSIDSSPVPGTFSFAFSIAAGFTPNDEYCLVLISGIGTQHVARYHVPTQTWVDHDAVAPGTQHIDLGPTYGVPTGMEVSADGTFAVISGLGAGSAGWALRLDLLDPTSSPNFAVTPYLPGMALLPGAYGASLSRDGTMAAFTSTTPAKLLILDSATGALLANIPLPGASNIYTATWR
jgi:hypothetical protein